MEQVKKELLTAHDHLSNVLAQRAGLKTKLADLEDGKTRLELEVAYLIAGETTTDDKGVSKPLCKNQLERDSEQSRRLSNHERYLKIVNELKEVKNKLLLCEAEVQIVELKCRNFRSVLDYEANFAEGGLR